MSGSTPPRHDPPWTPRQRQVLDLLVRGKTNAEIGQELGIGLEGVKWHVSEILGKLGVASREDAAEYWRRRNRLPSRLHRATRGALAGSPGLKWVGIGTAASAALALAVILLLITGNEDNDLAIEPDTAWLAYIERDINEDEPALSTALLHIVAPSGEDTVIARDALFVWWAPDGRYVLAWVLLTRDLPAGGEFVAFDRSGKRLWSIPPTGYGAWEIATGPDGLLAVLGGQSTRVFRDGRLAHEWPEAALHPRLLGGPLPFALWAPDGRALALATDRGPALATVDGSFRLLPMPAEWKEGDPSFVRPFRWRDAQAISWVMYNSPDGASSPLLHRTGGPGASWEPDPDGGDWAVQPGATPPAVAGRRAIFSKPSADYRADVYAMIDEARTTSPAFYGLLVVHPTGKVSRFDLTTGDLSYHGRSTDFDVVVMR